MNKKTKKMGRPLKGIDWAKFEFACKLIATKEEICGLLEVSDATLQRKIKEKYDDTFEGVLKKLSADAKVSLRRIQFRMAEKSAAMAIWLGKQYLDQVDTREVTIPDAGKYFAEIANAISRTDTNTESVLS